MNILEEPSGNYLVNRGEKILASRGDSLQIMITDMEDSFLKAIYLKSYFKKTEAEYIDNSEGGALDIRISMAIGDVDQIPEEIGKTMAEPFVLSGRALDQMKAKRQSFILTTNNAEYNNELELACAFLENIFDNWTMAQAEVIYYLVQGFKQKEIAAKLNLSQPSVSNRIQLAQWNLIVKMNKRFLEIIEKV